jgi:hypothetical protein
MYAWPYQPLLPGGEQLDEAAGGTTTNVSATATAVGVPTVVLQIGKIIANAAAGVPTVAADEVYLLAAAATAVGVASVTLLFIAAPAAAPAADTTKAEPLLVNPGQWIKA